MRKLLALVLLPIAVSAVRAQSLPRPVTAERAVSDVVRLGAAGDQSIVGVATNGDIALVVWIDNRQSGGTYPLYAARVDAQGNVLDPLGVRIGSSGYNLGVSAVVWNGESFVIPRRSDLLFVTADMAVTTKHLLMPDSYYFIAVTSGPESRFLYLREQFPDVLAAVVDAHGDVIAADKRIWSPSYGYPISILAGANASRFLLLADQRLTVMLDRDANLLSAHPFGVPYVKDEAITIAGGDDGFLVAQASPQGLAAYLFDSDGVWTRRSFGVDFAPAFFASIVREDNGYLIAWRSLVADKTYAMVATIGLDGTVSKRQMDESPRYGAVKIASYRGRRFLVSDIASEQRAPDPFVRTLSPTLVPGEPRLVTTTANQQTQPAMSASSNGYAVAWLEYCPDANKRIYVRRFSPAGLPQDDAPLIVYTQPGISSFLSAPTMVSNGETYLIGWWTYGGVMVRRLAARTAEWLDPIPVPIDMPGAFHLASNGVDAIAIGSTFTRPIATLFARRINLTGTALTSPLVTLRKMNHVDFEGPVIESNGTDYLAAWVEPDHCYNVDLCAATAAPIYALRVRADATAIDSAPLPLDDGKHYPERAAIASAAGRYFVTWIDNVDVRSPRGTRVTAEGAVLDHAADGGGASFGAEEVILSRLQDRFLVLLRRFNHDDYFYPVPSGIDAALIDPTAPQLKAVAFGALLGSEVQFWPAVTSRGSVLAVAYSRIEDGEAGGVERVFFRLLSSEPPRHYATRH